MIVLVTIHRWRWMVSGSSSSSVVVVISSHMCSSLLCNNTREVWLIALKIPEVYFYLFQFFCVINMIWPGWESFLGFGEEKKTLIFNMGYFGCSLLIVSFWEFFFTTQYTIIIVCAINSLFFFFFFSLHFLFNEKQVLLSAFYCVGESDLICMLWVSLLPNIQNNWALSLSLFPFSL